MPRLPVREVVSATHDITDLTLGLGEVVFDHLKVAQLTLKGISQCPVSIERWRSSPGPPAGIGKEIALRFAGEGGIPVIADLNLDAADATARETKAKRPDAFAVGMNVGRAFHIAPACLGAFKCRFVGIAVHGKLQTCSG